MYKNYLKEVTVEVITNTISKLQTHKILFICQNHRGVFDNLLWYICEKYSALESQQKTP